MQFYNNLKEMIEAEKQRLDQEEKNKGTYLYFINSARLC